MESYGDVISIDTTFCTNYFNMFLMPICMADNHGSTVTSHWVLLNDQTETSFTWALQQIREWSDRAPKVIFSDGDLQICKACHKVCAVLVLVMALF
jgi:hypothetical protein